MKLFSLAPVWLFAFESMAVGEAPKTEGELIARFGEALASKDPAKLAELTYRDGMSEQDEAMLERANTRLIGMATEVVDVVLKPLPSDFQSVAILHGKKIEMTAPAEGLIEVSFRGGAMGASASSTPYARIAAAYCLVGPKSFDLGWAGPPDRNIGFSVVGQGLDDLRIVVEWNASGVVQKREFTERSITFWGQHIDSVTVSSESVESDARLTILEGGEVIHESESLVGKGKLEYQRKATP